MDLFSVCEWTVAPVRLDVLMVELGPRNATADTVAEVVCVASRELLLLLLLLLLLVAWTHRERATVPGQCPGIWLFHAAPSRLGYAVFHLMIRVEDSVCSFCVIFHASLNTHAWEQPLCNNSCLIFYLCWVFCISFILGGWVF